MRAVLFLWLLWHPPLVTSQQPAPAPPKHVQQPKADSGKHGNSPTHDERPTPKMVPILQPPAPPANQPIASARQAEQQNYASAEWPLVEVTFLLVIVTAVLALYTAKLWGSTKRLAVGAKATADRQAAEMRESLNMAQRTIETTERNAELELRAYLSRAPSERHLEVSDQRGTVFEFRVRINNDGKTPAYRVRSGGAVIILQVPLPPDVSLEVRQPDINPSETIVGPGRGLIVSLLTEPLSPQEIADVKAGTEKKMFLFIIVTYRDIFDKPRRLKIFDSILWKPDGPKAVPYKDFNKAD
jgi:hypothetical protein